MRILAYLRSLPSSKWASILIGLSLLTHGAACLIYGDTQGAAVDLTGLIGTLGLPGLLGQDWQIQIVRAPKPDTTAPPSPQ